MITAPKPNGTQILSVQVPTSLTQRLDVQLKRLNQPFEDERRVSRSFLVRRAIITWLAEQEAQSVHAIHSTP
jgi:metal-responsive CopG/Arc/MetJ family transcriptional regulator